MKTDTWPRFVTDIVIACLLLTRLPMPHLPNSAFDVSARAVWAYPIAGALVGSIACLAGGLALMAGLQSTVAAVLVVGLLVLSTGAMHEDGLADTADGFWGGFTVQRRLEIMKDSQIGTYGTLALILALGLRWSCYAALIPSGLGPVIAAAALSRAIMPVLMLGLPNARQSGVSHGVGQPSLPAVLGGLGLAVSGSLILAGPPALAASVIAGATGLGMGALARHKIGGQTGDVLGATQQLTEISVLCVFLIATAQ
ncbi:adenosylcobinamide-GDP ribazoletransferase [Roseobacter weihaiensis]|uniref:adenosylcobinamide-GDP ribazoletransferase n=1 Tax=Roseobacter weihaiensis TaxID=2763262 RepID=UPI001D0AFD18|nr:adenosylcobinamide-GDP ribazoletransferase [Roseobacter sp. H9]